MSFLYSPVLLELRPGFRPRLLPITDVALTESSFKNPRVEDTVNIYH